MSREYNPISNALSQETKSLEEINSATSRLFENSNLEVLYKSKNREIKAYLDISNMVVYVMDKQEQKITVNIKDIYSWNKDKNIKEIIYWELKEKNGNLDKDLYMNTVIECSLQEVKKIDNDKIIETEEEFEKSFLDKAKTEKEKKHSIIFFLQ